MKPSQSLFLLLLPPFDPSTFPGFLVLPALFAFHSVFVGLIIALILVLLHLLRRLFPPFVMPLSSSASVSTSASSSSSSLTLASSSGDTCGGSKDRMRQFTLQELRRYDGRPPLPMLLSLRGVVYDISSHHNGPPLYQHPSAYSIFPGRDISYCMGALSLDPADLDRTDWDTALGCVQRKTLDEWVTVFNKKYQVAGWLPGYISKEDLERIARLASTHTDTVTGYRMQEKVN